MPAVVVEDPPGRYRLNPDTTAFAEAVIERELSRRQDARIRHAHLAILVSLPARHLRVIQARRVAIVAASASRTAWRERGETAGRFVEKRSASQ
jgi:hypothetical protein